MLYTIQNEDEIENGNSVCVKETATQLKSRKQPEATTGFSTQRENSSNRDGIHVAP